MFTKHKGIILGALLVLTGVVSGQAPLIQQGLASLTGAVVKAVE